MNLTRKCCSAVSQDRLCIAILMGIFLCAPAPAAIHVLVDQVGYELHAPKQALIIESSVDPTPLTFSLINVESGKTVLEGKPVSSGTVQAWTDMVFWTVDFGSWQQAGHYALRVSSSAGEVASCGFTIGADVLER